jgi:hypothetical protein
MTYSPSGNVVASLVLVNDLGCVLVILHYLTRAQLPPLT